MANNPTPEGRTARAASPQVAEPHPGTWSNCLVTGGIAYVAGMTASGGDLSDEYTQSKSIFGKIKHLIEAARGTMTDIVTVTIFVTDIVAYRAARKELGPIWRARMGVHFPAMALVGTTALVEPEALIEIQAVAYLDHA